MFRQNIILKIKEQLDKDVNFSSSDFSIKTEYKSLKIVYEYDNEYFFQVDVPYEISKLSKTQKETTTLGMITKHMEREYEAYEFSGKIRPGQVAVEERIQFEGPDKIFNYLKTWLENLWVEITIQPQVRKAKELEEQIIDIKSKCENISEDYFTRDEADALKQKLDILEQNFREKLEIEIQDKILLFQALDELHKELEKLKSQTTSLNKKNWFKSFGVKIYTWASKEENRKFLKDTKDFIKPFLPDSIDILP